MFDGLKVTVRRFLLGKKRRRQMDLEINVACFIYNEFLSGGWASGVTMSKNMSYIFSETYFVMCPDAVKVFGKNRLLKLLKSEPLKSFNVQTKFAEGLVSGQFVLLNEELKDKIQNMSGERRIKDVLWEIGMSNPAPKKIQINR